MEYVRRIGAFGAIVAIPDPHNAGGYLVIRELGQRPAQPKPEGYSKILRERLLAVEGQQAAVTSLARELGLNPVPEQVHVLFPREFEELLLRLALEFSHRKAEEIELTRYRVQPDGNTYKVVVMTQVEKQDRGR
jgi:hypothetical protein